MHENEVLDILESEGIEYILTLPCDRTKELCALISERFREVGLCREEDGIGISAGLSLAGRRPVLHIQSSGLGNSLNAIMTLPFLYGLPLPVLASWRGVYREKISAQIPFNSALPGVLDALGLRYTIIEEASEIPLIREVIRDAFEKTRPHIALISPKVWEGRDECQREERFPARSHEISLQHTGIFREPVMKRADAINIISEEITDELVVSNIGVPSKELCAAGDRAANFYMLGSYTQATPLGLGLALGSDKEVVVLDGDGSLLGTAVLPVVAALMPENLTIICLDNGAFGSTGNQMTPAWMGVDLELSARAAGIQRTAKVHTPQELRRAWRDRKEGPVLIHVIIRPGNSAAPGIPLSAEEIKERFRMSSES